MTSNNNLDIKSQLTNSLALNYQMQTKLLVMREKLEGLLSSIKDSNKVNEPEESVSKKKKKSRWGFGENGSHTLGESFYLMGSMFFKDADCRNCPNNEDYKRRKLENEMFPMDLNMKPKHFWSPRDKQRVVQAAKDQIIDCLKKTNNGKKNKKLKGEKLTKLINMIPVDFRIEWDIVQNEYMSHRHSAKSCEAYWNSLLHPSLKCSAWSKEENLKLVEAAKQYDFQNWQAIAKKVGQRSEYQCIVQYKNKAYNVLPETHTKWSEEDDKRLIEIVQRNTMDGKTNWLIVNSFFPHKAKSTLYSRYHFTLNPDIKLSTVFTPEEDRLLIAAVKEYGKQFNRIPRSLFPNRLPIQLRSHYNYILSKRHKHQPWSADDDVKLMNFVTENGFKWTDCEKFLHERHSARSCRTRYEVIKKKLEENPDCSIENLSRKPASARFKKSVTLNNWKEDVEEISSSAKVVEQDVEQGVEQKSKKKILRKNKIEKKVVNGSSSLSTNGVKQKCKDKIQKTCDNRAKKAKDFRQKSKKKIHKKQKIAEEQEKPYVQKIGLTDRKLYDFFKYAYSFQINQHASNNVERKSENFTMVFSALNPQMSFCNIDSSIPQLIKQNIKEISPQLSTSETPKLLPPDWSTSMGFRALCLNTVDISSNTPYRNIKNNINNDYIKKFRERLRLIFYSTIILSRLDPTLVAGINDKFQEVKYE